MQCALCVSHMIIRAQKKRGEKCVLINFMHENILHVTTIRNNSDCIAHKVARCFHARIQYLQKDFFWIFPMLA